MMRSEFETLPKSLTKMTSKDDLTRQEFDEAVDRIKKVKAVGMDGIPAEVWKHLTVARDALFEFLKEVWSKQTVPDNLAVCVFVMIFTNKDSHNDCNKYRAIGLFN